MATARAGGEAEQPLPLRVATTLGEGVGGARGGAVPPLPTGGVTPEGRARTGLLGTVVQSSAGGRVGGEVVLGLEKTCPSFNSAFCIVCSYVLPTEDADGEHLIRICLRIQDLCF